MIRNSFFFRHYSFLDVCYFHPDHIEWRYEFSSKLTFYSYYAVAVVFQEKCEIYHPVN